MTLVNGWVLRPSFDKGVVRLERAFWALLGIASMCGWLVGLNEHSVCTILNFQTVVSGKRLTFEIGAEWGWLGFLQRCFPVFYGTGVGSLGLTTFYEIVLLPLS